MLDNLAQLHSAIVAGLRSTVTGVATIDAYPSIQRRIVLPAVLLELSEMEMGDDPGTGELALVGRFQARAIVDPNQASADLWVRELAAQIALSIHQQTWGLEIGAAQFVQMGEDSWKPELDGYLCWVVEWTHQFHLGVQTWPYPDENKTILLGIYPDTGLGHQGDYWQADTLPDL